MAVNREVLAQAEMPTRAGRIVLDMDSSESPVQSFAGTAELQALGAWFSSRVSSSALKHDEVPRRLPTLASPTTGNHGSTAPPTYEFPEPLIAGGVASPDSHSR